MTSVHVMEDSQASIDASSIYGDGDVYGDDYGDGYGDGY